MNDMNKDDLKLLIEDTGDRIDRANKAMLARLGVTRKRGAFLTYSAELKYEKDDDLLSSAMNRTGLSMGQRDQYEFGWKVTKRHADDDEILVRRCDTDSDEAVWHKLSKTPLHFRVWLTDRVIKYGSSDLHAKVSRLRIIGKALCDHERQRNEAMQRRLEQIKEEQENG